MATSSQLAGHTARRSLSEVGATRTDVGRMEIISADFVHDCTITRLLSTFVIQHPPTPTDGLVRKLTPAAASPLRTFHPHLYPSRHADHTALMISTSTTIRGPHGAYDLNIMHNFATAFTLTTTEWQRPRTLRSRKPVPVPLYSQVSASSLLGLDYWHGRRTIWFAPLPPSLPHFSPRRSCVTLRSKMPR